jgi:hypothetical protein
MIDCSLLSPPFKMSTEYVEKKNENVVCTGHNVQEDGLVGELPDAVAGDEADVHAGVLRLHVLQD